MPLEPDHLITAERARALAGGVTRTTIMRWSKLEADPFPAPLLADRGTVVYDIRAVRGWCLRHGYPKERRT